MEMSENSSNAQIEQDVTPNEGAAVQPAVPAENEPAQAAEPQAEEKVEPEVIVEPAEEPKAEEPAEEPKAEEPAEEPKAEEPAEEPKAEEPAEEPKAEEPAEEPKAEEPAEEPKPAVDYSQFNKDELLEKLESLVEKPVEEIKNDVAIIKGLFFAMRKEEIAKEREEFVAAGNEAEAFVPADCPLETRVKDLLNTVRAKKAEFNAAQDAVKEENLKKKLEIIEKIHTYCDDADNINRHYNEVQQLQQEFKSAGDVPPQKATETWKSFQQAVERFYDLLKINKELRDYDFKKNLDAKRKLCDEAEALSDESDIIIAFKKLQDLHDTWRDVGPVAKDIREELWARFKNASSVINKKYQSFFEERKASEKANAEAKTALCEKMEAVETDGLKTYAAWDAATKSVIELQNEWRKVGFASRKLNNDLFKRFRAACDMFFTKKTEFFRVMKEELSGNLKRKTELCEKAEALKDSTDWKETTDTLVALQKEWKTIGPVAKKHSDAVWKRFIGACDYFFEQKKKLSSSIHSEEHANLEKKKEIIAQLNAILAEETADESAPRKVRELMAQWQSVGHVPFKEKDKVYADYRAAIDKAFETLDMHTSRARLNNFETSISNLAQDGDKMNREREKLVRVYEQKRNELKTYENNLGFFTARSKDGSALVKEMERKIVRLKEDIDLLEKKIKLIDEKS